MNTDNIAAVCAAYRYSKLTRDVLELGFSNLPTRGVAGPRYDDPQVTEAIIRCAAVIASASIDKLLETVDASDSALSTQTKE